MKPKLHVRDWAISRGLKRAKTAIFPNFDVKRAPTDITAEWDVPVKMRDGAILRLNIFRPSSGKPAPVIMSAHPYGKDRIPAKTKSGYGRHLQSRFLPQPRKVVISQWTGWESPDPAFWVHRGFVVINADLRGGGTSDGPGDLFSDEEALDYRELIEWAGEQSWSSGRVALDGVGYLAIAQYKVAALKPPHLAAIVPWEGFSDIYRDFARPGGVREDGFSILWSNLTGAKTRMRSSMRDGIVEHTELDDWYKSRTADIDSIETPMLVCGSFSDSNLHTRGAFELFRRAASENKWLYTHRDGKWTGYYADEALAYRLRFYNYILKDIDDGFSTEPRIRLAIHEEGSDPVAIEQVNTWPPEGVSWRKLWLDASSGKMSGGLPWPSSASRSFGTHGHGLFFTWTAPEDVDLIGPMALELFVDLRGADDATLFVGVHKVHAGYESTFEGSYGFPHDIMSKGWLRVSHRELDPVLSAPERPTHKHDRRVPVKEGEIVPVQIALREHATRFRKGDELRVEVRGNWLYRTKQFGQFPAFYEPGEKARCTLHTGGQYSAHLLVGMRP